MAVEAVHGEAGEPVVVAEPAAAVEAPAHVATVPALTEVAIEILVDLGSRTSKQGDTFPLRLAAPIVIDGADVIPAGTPGMGEVIHAKKSGGSGAGGELVLAARYLEVGGRQLPLRSLRIDAMVKDRMVLAMAASVAFTPLGFFIKGDQLSIGAGSVLPAKTAADFTVEILRAGAVPSAETTVPASEPNSATGGETQ